MPSNHEAKSIRYISIEPDWPNLARWHAKALADHSFNAGAIEPIVSFIEQIRYLDRSNPQELEKILEELRAKSKGGR